jgi:hypothetical protein
VKGETQYDVVGAVAVILLYFLYLAGCWLYERFCLAPEERWRRRYDRRLKKHFKRLY